MAEFDKGRSDTAAAAAEKARLRVAEVKAEAEATARLKVAEAVAEAEAEAATAAEAATEAAAEAKATARAATVRRAAVVKAKAEDSEGSEGREGREFKAVPLDAPQDMSGYMLNFTPSEGQNTQNLRLAHKIALEYSDRLMATDGPKDPRYKALMTALLTAMEGEITSHKTAKADHKLATEQRTIAIDLADAKQARVTAASNMMSLANIVVRGAMTSHKTGRKVRAAAYAEWKAKEDSE